ncbi:MAG TPA: hypothetical protein VFX70_18905 [Mycobacteriales bacterium]|nr:hypothetical protein [Mycobacteriales bacterium]
MRRSDSGMRHEGSDISATPSDRAVAVRDRIAPTERRPGLLARAFRPALRIRRADWLAVAVLVAVPALMFGIPALVGHVVLPTDDLDQNYPLRVLVGRELRAGQWPVLNPYIWSGSSLLGGWNAGAAYPLTWLFAVMPPVGAWVVTEVATYATAGLGLYAFCRNERLRPVASLLAGLSFSLGGAFASHLGHIGLVAGASWIPLIMLGLARLSVRASWPSRARWVVVLGLAGGLCVLAGEPRAIDTAALVAGGYGLWRLLRCGRVRWTFAGLAAAAGVLAVLLGAVQWAPGLAAVDTSQRAAATYALFARGSLHISWLSLVAVPTLLGGSGSLHLPAYYASYNLPEVASYVGLLPLVAATALLARLPLWRRWFRRADPADRADRADRPERARRGWPEWLVWHGLGLVGVVLALGDNTPLGPIIHRVPLFGDQRLQSRNIMVADLALAVLLAYWADGWLARRARARTPVPERVLAGLPLLGVAALAAVGIWRGPGLVRRLNVDLAAAGQASAMWPAFTASLVLAVVVAAFLRYGPRLGNRARAGILVALVSLDLAGFGAVSSVPYPLPSTARTVATMPDPPAPFDQIGRDGRFAVYAPAGTDELRLGGVGITDLNVLASRYSMQGYTAIVDGTYAAATGTHLANGGGHNTLSLATASNGILDQLATKYLIAPSAYLFTDVTDAVGGDGATGAAPQPIGDVVRKLDVGQSTSWYFAETRAVTSVSLPLDPSLTGAATPRVGLLLPGGATRWLTDPRPAGGAVPAITVRADGPGGTGAVGVVVRATGAPVARLTGPTVHTADGLALLAHGRVQDAMTGSGWTFAGTLDGAAVFTNPHAGPPLSLRALPGGSLAGATVRRTAGDPLWPTSAAVSSPAGAVVLRAVAATPGWTAAWRPDGGTTRTLPVTQTGLIQAVTVPAGTGVLSWHYRTPGLADGARLGIAGLVVTVALLAAASVGGARNRTGRQPVE